MVAPWRNAGSLEQFRIQINEKFPNRSKAADGTIGDAAHASRSSDHNPWIKDGNMGIVRALDITHDPKNGVDTYRMADNIRLAHYIKPDPRTDYLISNGRIWNPAASKDWRKYTGSNPHDHHMHISVDTEKKNYDNRAPWNLGDLSKPVHLPGDRPVQEVKLYPVLRRGSKGQDVVKLQKLLGVTADGDFGPATERAVKAFQTARSLGADGIAGYYTWSALEAAKAVADASNKLKGATESSIILPASNFDRVMEYVFQDEGGWTQNPDEPGGASNMGVSRESYSHYKGRNVSIDELKQITKAEAKQFYYDQYWKKIGADKLNTGLGYAAFDFGVNSGTSLVDQIGVDDYLSKAIREGDSAQEEIEILLDDRLKYMQRSPKWPKYKSGWSARVSRVRTRAMSMV
jgi:peptidoglycan hydrolase-like protein with peptidoglycan-binding domain